MSCAFLNSSVTAIASGSVAPKRARREPRRVGGSHKLLCFERVIFFVRQARGDPTRGNRPYRGERPWRHGSTQGLPRKTLCRAAGLCVSKLRLSAWRGVKSVIVHDVANAVPTETC